MASIPIDEQDVVRRALAAYFRTGGEGRPVQNNCELERHKRKAYVVLRGDVNQTVAVYRVRNDGMLKRMKRWPTELNKE